MSRDYQKALERARRLPVGDLISWADASLSTIGRNLADHARHPASGDFLREAHVEAATLLACLESAVAALPPPNQHLFQTKPSPELGAASVRSG